MFWKYKKETFIRHCYYCPQGLVNASQVDAALQRLLVARLRQGHFDHDPAVNPFAGVPENIVGQAQHLDKASEGVGWGSKSGDLKEGMQRKAGRRRSKLLFLPTRPL